MGTTRVALRRRGLGNWVGDEALADTPPTVRSADATAALIGDEF
jgi:hypothetical protein